MQKDKKEAISTRECEFFNGIMAKIRVIAAETKKKPAYIIKKVLWDFVNNWKKGDTI